MKRGAIDHPKMVALADALELPLYAAVGIFESLIHWTARYAPRGDIGRWSDEAIADGIRWERAHAVRLVGALTTVGFVDVDSEHRLLLHGWSEHADDAVHRQLARGLQTFADGTVPNTSRLGAKEKAKADRHFRSLKARAPKVRTPGAREEHVGRTSGAQNAPCQSPAPPRQSPASSSSSLSGNDLPGQDSRARARPRSQPEPRSENPDPGNASEPDDPAELVPVVVGIWESAGLPEPDLSPPVLAALTEACNRHRRLADWEYLVADRLQGQRNGKTGEPIRLEWLVAADIEAPKQRAEYADDRWWQCWRRARGPE